MRGNQSFRAVSEESVGIDFSLRCLGVLGASAVN